MNSLSAPMRAIQRIGENRESCAIHERDRRCNRGGCIQDESQSLGMPGKTEYTPMMRKSEDLLKYSSLSACIPGVSQ